MKKRLFFLIALMCCFVLAACALSACNESDLSAFYGTYESLWGVGDITIDENGASTPETNAPVSVSDGKLTIEYDRIPWVMTPYENNDVLVLGEPSRFDENNIRTRSGYFSGHLVNFFGTGVSEQFSFSADGSYSYIDVSSGGYMQHSGSYKLQDGVLCMRGVTWGGRSVRCGYYITENYEFYINVYVRNLDRFTSASDPTPLPTDPVIEYAISDTGRGEIQGDTHQQLGEGETGTPVTAIAHEGYIFTQWSDGRTDNPRTDGNLEESTTVYAEFRRIELTLAYTAGTGGSITGETSQMVLYGDNGTEVTAVPDEGYEFVRWSDGVTTAARTDSNVTSDVNVTAEFRHIELTLTYTAGTGGSITGEASQTVLYGESGTAVTAVPDEGYEFVCWSDGRTDNPRTDSNVTSDINVTAEFALEPALLFEEVFYKLGSYATYKYILDADLSVSDGYWYSWVEAYYAHDLYNFPFLFGSNDNELPAVTGLVSANVPLRDESGVLYAQVLAYMFKDTMTAAQLTEDQIDSLRGGSIASYIRVAGNVVWRVSSTNGDTELSEAILNELLAFDENLIDAQFDPEFIADALAREPANERCLNQYIINCGMSLGATGGISPPGDKTIFQYSQSEWGEENTSAVSADCYHEFMAAIIGADEDSEAWVDFHFPGQYKTPESTVYHDGDTLYADIAYITPDFPFSLTYIADVGGRIIGESSQIVLCGESGAEVIAVANDGYRFVKWSDGVTTATRIDSNVTADITVTAKFERIELALTYSSGAGGTLTGDTLQTVLYGDSGTAVTAVPDEGYEFVCWSDGGTDNPRIDSNIIASINVTAKFTDKQTKSLEEVFYKISSYVAYKYATGPSDVVSDQDWYGAAEAYFANDLYDFKGLFAPNENDIPAVQGLVYAVVPLIDDSGTSYMAAQVQAYLFANTATAAQLTEEQIDSLRVGLGGMVSYVRVVGNVVWRVSSTNGDTELSEAILNELLAFDENLIDAQFDPEFIADAFSRELPNEYFLNHYLIYFGGETAEDGGIGVPGDKTIFVYEQIEYDGNFDDIAFYPSFKAAIVGADEDSEAWVDFHFPGQYKTPESIVYRDGDTLYADIKYLS